jgi:GAF domain-containing protein
MVCTMASRADKLTFPVPERRTDLRHKVHSPAYATKDENSSFILPHLNEIVDIGEGGMCFQNSSSLDPGENLKLCLDLSETKTHIEADGEVVWSSDSGRTGVRFQRISPESAQQLREWLFINNIIACANHPRFVAATHSDLDSASDLLEYGELLLPDHTAVLVAVGVIGREVATLGVDADAALQLISDRALSLTRATGAAIALAGSENMICRASSGTDAPPIGVTLQVGSGFSGECVRTGQLLHCEDAETDLRVDQQSCKALGVRSMIAAPVWSGSQVVGLLEVFSPQANVFTESDKDILQRLAEIISRTIHRSNSPENDSLQEASTRDVQETEESGGSSRKTRLLLALAAALVATLLALILIPRVRSKVTDSPSAALMPVSSNHSTQKAVMTDSFEGLRVLAEKGDTGAQFALGIRYATGEQVRQDYSEAARWFSLAAEHGEVKAQSVLAAYYWDGTGVPKDLTKAYFWAILARANGDEPSSTRAAELATRISYQERNAIQLQADDWLREHSLSSISSNQ